MPVAQVMLQMGVVMLVAFIGAALASRLRLSVTIGYVVAGILIGPNISASVFGYTYTGLIQDTTFINQLSYFGLVLLLFFVGLQFPLSKLRATKDAAVILAVMNIGMSMFGGFIIGTYLGWPIIDTIFLAGVISMSSSAITAKSLIDLKRLSNAETQFLISMAVLESFLAMFLLTAVNGLVVSNTPESVDPPTLLLCILSFVGFFAFLAAVVVPRTARFFDMPTGEIGKLSQPGRPLYNIEHSNGGLITFPGGVPIKNAQGEVIGAIGVSGSTVENDHACAVAGAEAI